VASTVPLMRKRKRGKGERVRASCFLPPYFFPILFPSTSNDHFVYSLFSRSDHTFHDPRRFALSVVVRAARRYNARVYNSHRAAAGGGRGRVRGTQRMREQVRRGGSARERGTENERKREKEREREREREREGRRAVR